MITALWIAGFAVLAGVLVKRPWTLPIAVLAVWCLIPRVANATLLAPRVSPGAIFALTAFAVLLLARPRWVSRGISRNIVAVTALTFFLAIALTITALHHKESSAAALLLMFGSATAMFIMIRSISAGVPDALPRIACGVVGLAAIVCVLGMVQFVAGEPVFWTQFGVTDYWFRGEVPRVMGTLDSPLDLTLLCVIAIPLCAQIERLRTRWLCVGIIFIGMLMTQSRTGVVLAAIGVAFLVLRSNMNLSARLGTIFASAAVVALLFFVPNDLTSGVQRRFEESTLSTQARELAAQAFWANIRDAGGGYGSSNWFRLSGETTTSLENGYFMLAFDFGIPLTLFFLTIIVAVGLTGIVRKAPSGTVVSLALGAIFMAAYSGLGGPGTAVVLLYTTLALAQGRPAQQRESPILASVAQPKPQLNLTMR